MAALRLSHNDAFNRDYLIILPKKLKGCGRRIFSSTIPEEILMKMTRFGEPQILAILRQAEGGMPVAELCRQHGMSTASLYKSRAKYGGMDAMISQMKSLEDESRRLKRMFADLSMQADLLKEA